MFSSFRELENLFNSKCVRLQNQYMDKTIQNFDFKCLTKSNFMKEINQRKNNLSIITFDYFKDMDEKDKNEYLIFCLEYTVLIINISNISIIKYFFSYFAKSTFIWVSRIVIQFLERKYSDLKINYIKDNLYYFINDEIPFFQNNIISNNRKINRKLKIIKRCIAGYLIQKSYQKSNINRIDDLKKNQQTNIINKNGKLSKYIFLYDFRIGASTVKLAYNIEEEKLFVIKIHPHNDEELKLVNRELYNYKNLKHPLIPRLHEFFEEDEENYLVIEYINGKTLDKVNLNEFKEIELMNMIFELLISIHYLHSLGYIYRDLKPNNIVIDANKTAILIDFDRLINKKDYDESKEFTYDFGNKNISPEISNGEDFTNKTDIYSFGDMVNDIFLKGSLQNLSKNTISKLKIMHLYCTKENPNDRPTISLLIRYFYLNILSKIDEKQGIENKLIEILEYNLSIPNLFDPEMFCTLGMIFHQGHYIERNIEEAIKFYTHASEQNDFISMINLSDIYSNSKSIEILKQATKFNDPLPFFLLGGYSFASANIIESIKYSKAGLNFNFYGIQYILALNYFCLLPNNYYLAELNDLIKNTLITSNYQNTIEENNAFYDIHGKCIMPNVEVSLYYKLFSGDLFLTYYNQLIGCLYYTGKFVSKNVFLAAKYLYQASKQEIVTLQMFLEKNNLEQKYISDNDLNIVNNVLRHYNQCILNANSLLAQILQEGSYIKKNINKSIKYFTNSASQGDLIALLMLGYFFSNMDITKANHYFSLAEQNFNSSMKVYSDFLNYKKISPYFTQKLMNVFTNNNQINVYGILANQLGDIFYNGNCTQKDINKAIHYYEIASLYKDSNAQYKLGLIYLERTYDKENINKAIINFVSSAELNDRDSQLKLGLLYYEGKVIPKNIDKAIEYLELANKNGCPVARFYLGIIYCLKKNIEKAIYYFKESSNVNDFYAKNNLAIIYKCSEEIKKNIGFSKVFLQEALKIRENDVARYNLAHIYFFDYEENNIDKSIQLLIKSSLITNNADFQLLCLAIIEKCKLLTFDDITDKISVIENEIKGYHDKYKEIASKIHNEIISNEWNNLIKYSELYETIRKIEYFYIDHGKNIKTWIEFNNDCESYYIDYINQQNINEFNMKKNINTDFYEGFGLDL